MSDESDKVVEPNSRSFSLVSIVSYVLLLFAKIIIIGCLFFGTCGVIFGTAILFESLVPGFPFMVYLLLALPIYWCANRFVMSPVEYHLGLKSQQYDPCYEKRIEKNNSGKTEQQ